MTDIRTQAGGRPAIDPRKLAAHLRENRTVDMDVIGRVVAEMGPTLQGVGGDVMDTYIVGMNDSFCHLIKLPAQEAGGATIERVTLKTMLSRAQR
jgi:hypothetical protein